MGVQDLMPFVHSFLPRSMTLGECATDRKAINKTIAKYVFSIYSVYGILDKPNGSKIISTIDYMSGCHQI